MAFQKYKKSVIAWTFGFVILSVGVALLFSYESIFNAILKKELPLASDSILFPFWKDIPMPMYFKVYFFNVTNPDEFANHEGNNTLKLKELGPFVFRLYWNKKDIEFNANETISFRENQVYYFLQNESYGDLDTEITTLNGPMVIAGNLCVKCHVWQKVGLSVMMKLLHEKLFVTKTVREFLFEGYHDPLLAIGKKFFPNLPNTKGFFAYFYQKNDTNDGLFNMFTGVHDITEANLINRLNGDENLNFWNGTKCNKLSTSSNAELSPPIRKGQETLDIFRSDICRPFTLSYETEQRYFSVDTIRFSANSSVLANSSVNPENHCYELEGAQLPSGAMDISACHGGASIILSQPHFYQGDAKLSENIEGLAPNKSKHAFVIDIDPVIGLTLSMAARVQINLRLQSIPKIPQLEDYPDMVFPVLWQDITGTVTAEQADIVYRQAHYPVYIFWLSSLGIIGVGGLIAFLSAAYAFYIHCKKDPALSNIEDDEGLLINNSDGDNEATES